MNALKDIYRNCQKATFLIEKKQIGSIRISQHIALAFHLAFCSLCRTYQRQSRLINFTMKEIVDEIAHSPILDEQFKDALQKKITEQLNLE